MEGAWIVCLNGKSLALGAVSEGSISLPSVVQQIDSDPFLEPEIQLFPLLKQHLPIGPSNQILFLAFPACTSAAFWETRGPWLKKLLQFAFEELQFPAVFTACNAQLAAIGCNAENALIFEELSWEDCILISPIVEFKPVPFAITSTNLSSNEIAPALAQRLFAPALDIEKRALVCEKVIFCTQGLIDRQQSLLKELEEYFCRSPLAASTQPQDFTLCPIPEYLTAFREQPSLSAWLGACILLRTTLLPDPKGCCLLAEEWAELNSTPARGNIRNLLRTKQLINF